MNQQWQQHWLACQQEKANAEALARTATEQIIEHGYWHCDRSIPRAPVPTEAEPPRTGRVKKLKVSLINLAGPVIIGDVALFALQLGQTFLADVAGIMFLLTLIIGAASVRIVWR